MQKVMLLTPSIEEHNRSMEIYAEELIRAFKEQKLPIEPFINTVHQIMPEKLPLPLPISPKTILPENILFKYCVYPTKIKVLPDHLIHITDHSYGHVLYSAQKNKTVITCHDLTLLKFKSRIIKNNADKDKLKLFKYSAAALARADAIITDSKATQNDIEMLLGIPKAKIKVIPLGINFLFKPEPDTKSVHSFKKKYFLENTFTLLHVGNNAFYKNVSFIFKTLYLLIHTFKLKIKLLKVGSDFTDFQKMMIRNLGLTPYIIHLGDITTAHLVTVYNAADILIYPSLNEGFGLPPLEAMACGTPVIASNLGAIPGVVGHAGILLRPKDPKEWAAKIVSIIENSSQAQNLTEAGIARAKMFSWKKTADQTFEVYQQVLHK